MTSGLTLREVLRRACVSRKFATAATCSCCSRYLRPAWDDLISRGHGAIRRQGGPAFFAERQKSRQGDGWLGWYANFEIAPNLHDGYYVYVRRAAEVPHRRPLRCRSRPVRHEAAGLGGVAGRRDFGSFDARRVELYSNLNWFITTPRSCAKLQAIAIDAEAITMRTPECADGA
jgi:hypothetical protein